MSATVLVSDRRGAAIPVQERGRTRASTDLLAAHAGVPKGGGRALEVGCCAGELSVHLASLGFAVDGVDFAAAALERGRTEHAGMEKVRWLAWMWRAMT